MQQIDRKNTRIKTTKCQKSALLFRRILSLDFDKNSPNLQDVHGCSDLRDSPALHYFEFGRIAT